MTMVACQGSYHCLLRVLPLLVIYRSSQPLKLHEIIPSIQITVQPVSTDIHIIQIGNIPRSVNHSDGCLRIILPAPTEMILRFFHASVGIFNADIVHSRTVQIEVQLLPATIPGCIPIKTHPRATAQFGRTGVVCITDIIIVIKTFDFYVARSKTDHQHGYQSPTYVFECVRFHIPLFLMVIISIIFSLGQK